MSKQKTSSEMSFSQYRKSICGNGKVVIQRFSDGTSRRVTPGRIERERHAAALADRFRSLLGKVVASYTDEHGCFVGTVTKATKTSITVTTRAGVNIKMNGIELDPEYTFEKWDAMLAAANEESSKAGKPNVRVTL